MVMPAPVAKPVKRPAAIIAMPFNMPFAWRCAFIAAINYPAVKSEYSFSCLVILNNCFAWLNIAAAFFTLNGVTAFNSHSVAAIHIRNGFRSCFVI
jgi:hypothetical protein